METQKHRHTQKEAGNMKTEAETGVRYWPRSIRIAEELPEKAGRSKQDSSDGFC